MDMNDLGVFSDCDSSLGEYESLRRSRADDAEKDEVGYCSSSDESSDAASLRRAAASATDSVADADAAYSR